MFSKLKGRRLIPVAAPETEACPPLILDLTSFLGPKLAGGLLAGGGGLQARSRSRAEETGNGKKPSSPFTRTSGTFHGSVSEVSYPSRELKQEKTLTLNSETQGPDQGPGQRPDQTSPSPEAKEE